MSADSDTLFGLTAAGAVFLATAMALAGMRLGGLLWGFVACLGTFGMVLLVAAWRASGRS